MNVVSLVTTLAAGFALRFCARRYKSWYLRSLRRCSRLNAPNVLRYPDCIVPILWVGCVFFALLMTLEALGFAILCNEVGLVIAAPCLIATVATAWILRQAAFTLSSFSTDWFVVTHYGFEFNTLLNGHGTLAWDEVVRIRSAIGWIQVVTTDNTIIWISLSVCHLSTFAATALAKVDPTAMGWRARRCLRIIATGPLLF
jgi:hypothetical protein